MRHLYRRRCPVCWQGILATVGGCVYQHWDSVGQDICPMSGEPYEYALTASRTMRRQHVAVVA